VNGRNLKSCTRLFLLLRQASTLDGGGEGDEQGDLTLKLNIAWWERIKAMVLNGAISSGRKDWIRR